MNSGTPPRIVDHLNTSMRKDLDDEDFQAWLSERGVETMHGSPEAFGEFLRSETERWERSCGIRAHASSERSG